MKGRAGIIIGFIASLVVILSFLPLIVLCVGVFTVSRGPALRWGE